MASEDELASAIRHSLPGETGVLFAEYDDLIDGSVGGTTALVFACYIGRQDVALAIAGRRLTLRPFEAAAIGDTVSLARLIAEDGGALESEAPDGFQPLGLACCFKQEATVKLLLEAGASVASPSRNASRVAPLHSAVAARHPGIIQLLLAHGAPVDATQQNGFTPLMAAAHQGDTVIVDLLLRHHADAALRDDDGKTAADHARASGHQELAERLYVPGPSVEAEEMPGADSQAKLG